MRRQQRTLECLKHTKKHKFLLSTHFLNQTDLPQFEGMSKDSKHSNVNKQPKNKLNEKSLFTKSLRFYNGKPSQTVIISKLAVFKDVTRLLLVT